MEQANIIKIYKNETDNLDHGDQMTPSDSQESCVSPVLTMRLEDSVCHTAGQSCEEKSDSQQIKLENKVDEFTVSRPPQDDTNEDPDSPKYVCGYCGLMYCLQEEYLHHLNKQHGCDIKQAKLELDNSDISSLPVNMEEDKTKEPSPLKMDIKAESEPVTNTRLDILTNEKKKQHKCDVCGKVFKQTHGLTKHMQTHTDEQPYKCDVCGKAFTVNSNLTQHMRTHIGEKQHKCDVCGKAFTRGSNLRQHLATHTTHKPCKCDVCGKTFTRTSNLQTHLKTHTGERPYNCYVCGRAFAYNSMLTLHMRTHTGEKPYKCDVCGKAFAHDHRLVTHMRTHTGDLLKCDVCGKGFTQTCGLKYHMKTHTGVI